MRQPQPKQSCENRSRKLVVKVALNINVFLEYIYVQNQVRCLLLMMDSQERESIRDILSTAVSSLCQTAVTFHKQLTVKADIILGIDEQEPLHIDIDNVIKTPDSEYPDPCDETIDDATQQPEPADAEDEFGDEGVTHLEEVTEDEVRDAAEILHSIKQEVTNQGTTDKNPSEVVELPRAARKRGRPPGRKSSKGKKRIALARAWVKKEIDTEEDRIKEDHPASDPDISKTKRPKRKRIKLETDEDLKNIVRVGSIYKCERCEFSSKVKSAVRKHSVIHDRPELVCQFCDQTFPDRFSRKRHTNEVHFGEKIPCDICDKNFSTLGSMKLHKKKMHPEDCGGIGTGEYQCKACNQYFMTPNNLERHMKHATKCEICQQPVACKNDLRNHMRDCHPNASKLRQCEFCEKVLSSKTGMYQHKQLFHSGEKDPKKRNVFTCHVCGKGFPLYDYLKRHIRSHDANYQPYECPKCHKRFKYHRNCKTHKEGCMNEAGYQCHLCGKKLKNEYCLRVHVRNTHPSERKNNFPCSKCGATFPNTVSRSKHEQICMEYNIHEDQSPEENQVNDQQIIEKSEADDKQFVEEAVTHILGDANHNEHETIIHFVNDTEHALAEHMTGDHEVAQIPVQQIVEIYDEQGQYLPSETVSLHTLIQKNNSAVWFPNLAASQHQA